ncbi:ferritin-like domain-containing protein [Acidiphilium sp. PA]|uniref:ferritin-like domain-containing protein n=1 Tax=Acidiphilium sp. PA TaxID=2871705 RepID=UPI0022441B16|nr:ferritin-like domain-containing protein [Acidiphilium sp. PA]MCW8308369.1 ferritin-like domain-containing protein [Acidiphilium sp. PA]
MADTMVSTDNLFLRDVVALRSSVQEFLAAPSRPAHADDAISLLQAALTIEIVCVWRYTMMSVSARGLREERVGFEFQEQANDERKHTRMVAERIEQLGGVPNFQPKGLMSGLAMDYNADFDGMIAQNLKAEQSVVEYYTDLINHFHDSDPQTTAMLEIILQDEEDHATDMQDLLA